MRRIYFVNVPEGCGNSGFMNILMEGAVYRGFDVEAYYCPMDPREKIEHLIVPGLSLAFVTTNKWHDLEPWEITGEEDQMREITMIDISDFESGYFREKQSGLLVRLAGHYSAMMQEGIEALTQAKRNHDRVEEMYVRNMNFEKIDRLVEKTVEDIVSVSYTHLSEGVFLLLFRAVMPGKAVRVFMVLSRTVSFYLPVMATGILTAAFRNTAGFPRSMAALAAAGSEKTEND